MIRLVRWSLCAGAALTIVLSGQYARAQVACDNATTLPNPLIVTGSSAFEPTLKAFAVKLSAETTPTTIIYTSGATGSCVGVANVVNATDLGGTAGRYYTLNAGTITNNACTFAAGQKADLAISDVFYESCANVTQPKPATISDTPGPAQAMLFVVPKLNTTTQFLTYKEAQLIYGCGVSTTLTVAGFSDPAGVFCRDPNSGTQITVAKNIGLPESVPIAPKCVPSTMGTSGVITGVTTFSMPQGAVGFIAADAYDATTVRPTLNALAFQSLGQTQAFYADSSPDISDRRNVRDGHYTIWGNEHMIAQTTGGNVSQKVADMIGFINGTKTSPNFDYVAVEGGAGTIPICAMKVQRTTDAGLLRPYTPAEPCGCAFEAAITKSTPAACTACTTTCSGGLTCRHGFCE